MQAHFELVRTNPDYVANRLLIERRALAFRRAPRLVRPVMTIPVVVHVVYNAKEENVSDAQIKSQIAVLNKDFRALNGDKKKIPSPFKKLLGDARLNFKLAVRDPKGEPTNGITRTHTDQNYFYLENNVKFGSKGGIDAWPTDRYLNVWVCKLSGGLLGYAQFPGGPVETDGVVINYRTFGTTGTAESPYDKGRTTTHEIGHWLNLNHIWGDDNGGCHASDNVDDTPNQADSNSGKPSFPHITCSNGPNGDMFMNYMDYTDDDSMYMFSKGQCERMFATLDGDRASLQYSDGIKKATSKTAAIRLGSPASLRARGGETQLVFDGVQWVNDIIR